MLNLDFIKDQLGTSLISGKNSTSCNEKAKDIEILDRQSKLTSYFVYVGTQKKVEEILNSDVEIENGTLIFSAEAKYPLHGAILSGSYVEIIETSLSLAECVNLINSVLRKSRSFYRDAFFMSHENKTPLEYLEYIYEKTGASTFLFDMEGYVLAEVNHIPPKIPMMKKIMKDGRLPKGQMPALKTESKDCSYFRKFAMPEFDITFYFHTIPLSREESAIIMLAGGDLLESADLNTIMYYFEAPIASAIKSLRDIGLSEDDMRFNRVWESIMEKRYKSAAEILENLSGFSVKPLLFARILVVLYKKSAAPVSVMLSELHSIFPRGHVASGDQEFVIILYDSERPLSTDVENSILLKAFLEKYDAYLGFSCAARDLTILPNQYKIAKQIVTLALLLKLEPGERVFRHELYSVYCIIDSFAQQYCRVHGNNDIILLIHPAVVNLTRYDQLHNNNLRDILQEYLLSDSSVSKTAAKTYMHRNTIMNKLKKISEMIHVDLNDGIVSQQLLFSCQVMLYYERVMGLQISP